MITYWQQEDGKLIEKYEDELDGRKSTWVDARSVTRDDIAELEEKYGIDPENMLDILDPDELSRLEKNEEFKTDFKNIGKIEINALKEFNTTIITLANKFKDIVGNDSIFEILNCQFLHRDTQKIMEVLHDSFGSTLKTTSKLFLFISACELLMTLLIVISLKNFGTSSHPNSNDIEYKQL